MMKKKSISLLAAIVIFSFLPNPMSGLSAQDTSAADQEDEGFVYYYSVFSKFKPGKTKQAREFIYERFWSVDKVIGRKPLAFELLTGPWDHLVFFRLEGGLADAEIANTTQLKKWRAQFEKQEGGAEKADLAQKTFDTMVDETVTGIFKVPEQDVEMLEASYSFSANTKYFRTIITNCKPGKTEAATKLLLEDFRPARKATGRLAAAFFSVAGIYDHVIFMEIDPSELQSITMDQSDRDWIEAMGGEEKFGETQAKYFDLTRRIVREAAMARW